MYRIRSVVPGAGARLTRRTLLGCGASLTLAATVALGGCATTTGRAEVVMQGATGNRDRLEVEFVTAVYVTTAVEISVYLSDVPLESLLDPATTTAQVVHIEILWRPVPGETPIEAEATNASIRHVILVDGQIGIYGGAGFVKLRGKRDARRISLSTEDATMALLDSTDGFEDLLSPATYEGDVVAVRDPDMALRLRQAVAQRVTDAFGTPRFVDAASSPGRQLVLAGERSPAR